MRDYLELIGILFLMFLYQTVPFYHRFLVILFFSLRMAFLHLIFILFEELIVFGRYFAECVFYPTAILTGFESMFFHFSNVERWTPRTAFESLIPQMLFNTLHIVSSTQVLVS
jgi:hypothetical protein